MLRDLLVTLTNMLYPTGRAFKMGKDFTLEKLHYALSKSESQFIEDSKSTFDSALPDNDNFTEQDATDWERRLNITTSVGATLDNRKKAIIRKMNYPNNQLARQHWRWLDYQLQLAGFNVFVHENRFSDGFGGYETKTLYEVNPSSDFLDNVECGNAEYGEYEYGGILNNLCINHIEEEIDSLYSTDNGLRASIFIGGEILGDFANVPEVRRKEFKELIIKVKPIQEIAFLLINYV